MSEDSLSQALIPHQKAEFEARKSEYDAIRERIRKRAEELDLEIAAPFQPKLTTQIAAEEKSVTMLDNLVSFF